ncbi:MAG: hypothetical protein P1U58_05075 [Verrucomicrobiales bacterium]|nr:hypothetical protein [Verrucomicrobiales bacterium]
MAAIGGILAAAGGIAGLVIWIMTIVKAFKAKDTLWGVLSIFLPICGLIWLFMKGHKKLGIYWIIAIVLYMVGAGIIGGSGAMTQLQP